MTINPQTAMSETALCAMVLNFLSSAERPREWTFFRTIRPEARDAPSVPDIVIDAGGRIAYVELWRSGGGPLPPSRAAALVLARARGAPCFVVRSLPEMERALRALGIVLRPRGMLLPVADAPGGMEGGRDARRS